MNIDDLYAVIVNDVIYDSHLTINEANDLINELGYGDLIPMSEIDNI